MNILKRETIRPINVCAGDTLVGAIHDENGGEMVQRSVPVSRSLTVDTMVFVEGDAPELDLTDGIGVVFGKAV